MKIREALRMREEGFNNSQIARSVTVNLARSTVVELFRRCDAHTISYDMAQSMSDTDLEILLYPHKHKPTKSRAALEETVWLDYMATHGVDRQEAWEAYVQMEPDAVSYPQFCRRLRDYEKLHAPALDYPKRRMPGEIMESDWCGEKAAIVYDRKTESFIAAHFFVTSLGFSTKLFVKAYPNEKQAAWIDGHTSALEYYGALPKIVTPDNTKTAVKKVNRYDPEKNPVFASWGAHYGVGIIPARARKPKDKDRVEDAVGAFTRKILPKLKKQIFFDFHELNIAILLAVEKLNKRPYQKRPGSRTEIFSEVDLPAMRPLPAHRFSSPETKWATISKNGYHVHFDGHEYSAPYQLAGKRVLLVASRTTVELLYDNRRVALHARCYRRDQVYVTDPHHMPERHQAQRQEDVMTGERYLAWARSIGPHTASYIKTLLARSVIEEQSYRACMGILRLAEQHSPFQLERACQQALKIGVGGYQQIKRFILRDEPQEDSINQHHNLRGAKYYQEVTK